MKRAVMVVFGLWCAACSEGGTATSLDGGVGDGAGAVTGSFYIVPAGPSTPELSYPIEPAEIELIGADFKLGYNMPLLLVGQAQRVTLRGTLDAGGRTVLVGGTLGMGSCDLQPVSGATLRCNESLSGVIVDIAAVTALAQSTDPQLAPTWVAVAQRFKSEPVGILEVR